MQDEKGLIMDIGGGHISTISPYAWKLFQHTNHITDMTSYLGKNQKILSVVNRCTKATIHGC